MITTLEIQNLKCGGCALTITRKLTELHGIENVTVNTVVHSVTIESTHEEALEMAM
jgi:copper chaperone CopZ